MEALEGPYIILRWQDKSHAAPATNPQVLNDLGPDLGPVFQVWTNLGVYITSEWCICLEQVGQLVSGSDNPHSLESPTWMAPKNRIPKKRTWTFKGCPGWRSLSGGLGLPARAPLGRSWYSNIYWVCPTWMGTVVSAVGGGCTYRLGLSMSVRTYL